MGPGGGGLIEVKVCPDLFTSIGKLIAWNDAKKGNILRVCVQHWIDFHRTVVAGKCPTITFPEQQKHPAKPQKATAKAVCKAATQTSLPKISECEAAGMCVHEGEGLELYMFRNSVLACMKEMFPISNTNKRGYNARLEKYSFLITQLWRSIIVDDESLKRRSVR